MVKLVLGKRNMGAWGVGVYGLPVGVDEVGFDARYEGGLEADCQGHAVEEHVPRVGNEAE